jgi:bis(5'-nucleosidyl)-tetraphosphatase
LEAGESAMDAARREVAEEAGLADLHFDWGEVYIDTGPYGHGKVARYFLARSDDTAVTLGISPEIGRPEHNEFRWVDHEGALALAAARVREVIQWAAGLLDPVQ